MLFRSIVAVVTLILHIKASVTAFTTPPGDKRTVIGVIGAITDTLYYHPAQSSISWDIVWTTISTLVWKAYASANADQAQDSRLVRLMKDIGVALVGSVGLVFVYDEDVPAEREKTH